MSGAGPADAAATADASVPHPSGLATRSSADRTEPGSPRPCRGRGPGGNRCSAARPYSGIGPTSQRRIDAPVEQVDPPVEMGSRGAAGGPDLRDDLSLRHPLTLLHEDARQVQERRRQPVAVVDDHRAAGEEHVRMHQGDHAVRRRGDPGAGGRRDVDPEVRPPGLAVEDALRTVDAADPALDRPAEAAEEVGARVVDRARLLGHPDFRHDACDVFVAARRHLSRRQSVDALDVVLAAFDRQLPPCAPAVGKDHHELRRRRRIPPESDQEPAVLRHPHRIALELDGGARRRLPAQQAALDARAVEAYAGVGDDGPRTEREQYDERQPGEDGAHQRHCGVRDSRSPAPRACIAGRRLLAPGPGVRDTRSRRLIACGHGPCLCRRIHPRSSILA